MSKFLGGSELKDKVEKKRENFPTTRDFSMCEDIQRGVERREATEDETATMERRICVIGPGAKSRVTFPLDSFQLEERSAFSKRQGQDSWRTSAMSPSSHRGGDCPPSRLTTHGISRCSLSLLLHSDTPHEFIIPRFFVLIASPIFIPVRPAIRSLFRYFSESKNCARGCYIRCFVMWFKKSM